MSGDAQWLGSVGIWIVLALAALPPLWPRGRRWPGGEATLLAALLGLPQFVLVAHPLLLAGLPVSPAGFVVIWLCSLGVGLGVRAWLGAPEPPPPIPPERKVALVWVAFALVALAVSFHPLSAPFMDSWFYWVAKGNIFATHGDARIFPTTHGSSYPISAPIAHALFIRLGLAPGMVGWARALEVGTLLYACLWLTRRGGAAGLAAGALLAVPQFILWEKFGEGPGLYADTMVAASLTLSVALLAEILEGRAGRAWPSTLALAFFALTKDNAAPLFLPIAAAFLAAAGFNPFRLGARRAPFLLFVRLFALPIACLIAWRLELKGMGVATATDETAREALFKEILASAAPMKVYAHRLALSAGFCGRLLGWTRPWSLAFLRCMGWAPLAALAGLALWPKLARGERFAALAGVGGLTLMVAVVYCLTPAADDGESLWWLRTGFSRMALPSLAVCGLAAQCLLTRLVALGWCDVEESRESRPPAPTPASRLRVAAALPLAALLALLLRSPGDTDWRPIWRGFIALEKAGPEGDRCGLFDAEDWGGARVRWMGRKASFRVLRKGNRARVHYAIRHPDASPDRPVWVRIELEGAPPYEVLHNGAGYFDAEFDLTGQSDPMPRLTFEVDRTWSPSADGRKLGAALLPMEWVSGE